MLFEFEDENLNPIYEKICVQERLSLEDGLTLWKTPDLLGVGYLANRVRERMNGDKTYFIHIIKIKTVSKISMNMLI